MRTKVLVSATFLALLILLPAVYFRHGSESAPQNQSENAAPAAATAAKPAPVPRALRPIHASAPLASTDENGGDHHDYVVQRKAELVQMGMSDDPAALKAILGELNNQDPEIRKTALIATMDFGSQEAIPTLKNQLAWTDDAQEKMDIQKAIEFLQLPPARPNGEALPITQQPPGPAPAGDNN